MTGLVLGSVTAFVLSRLLRSHLYEVSPNDPAIYFLSIVVLLIPVLVATLRPALVAAHVNPVDALRSE